MKTKSSSRARSELCAVVAEASRGSPTTIAKRGRPVAMVISIDDAYRLYPEEFRQRLELKDTTSNPREG
ncbi:type II toxin-antitoxin system prevent-host-death family antitoxin [Mesorhizobium sp. B2-3-3]|uniref:type II toxin-antitoxin system Phd/YefM family antitoxin n=1 Tax=Mesorhizobium sp. B2-3-5 TaxID=2589958 RepID=UPI00112B796E|nr:type II toxin-antitoxin system prevent-host-death family antitoxin [Mesorhizobium sp. B2-3-5]TPM26035.1 type II toxin-antitoxin system prevent-host-death family antitoxin [Mesorhizobium sp. B2-3-5]TPN17887.1 type II toxin-antitoxin system prevent-host-death family antitoxin [Mesorhizobium sp. B2-3-3]